MNQPKISNDLARIKATYDHRDSQPNLLSKYSYFNQAYLYTIQQRQRAILREIKALGKQNLSDLSILEVGCGKGGVLLEFLNYGASSKRLIGSDLIFHRLEEAKSNLSGMQFCCADGQSLPFRDHSFDLLLQFTVFSSILDSQIKLNIAKEMIRVLKDDGAIIWYDFWTNPLNSETKGIKTKEIKQLFPNSTLNVSKITLAPPLTQRFINISWVFCWILEKTRILNSHNLVIIQKDILGQ